MIARITLWWVAVAGLCLASCEYYARPNRPVSESFQARYLSGEELGAADLRGAPTVIGVWVPR